MNIKFLKMKNNENKIFFLTLISIIVLLTAIFFYRSYAIYQEKQEWNVIKGNVPNQNYDALFSFLLEDETGQNQLIKTAPEDHKYDVLVTCNNNANGLWDYEKWAPIITDLNQNRTKCTILFKLTKPLEKYGIQEKLASQGSGLYRVTHENAIITFTTNKIQNQNFHQIEYRYAGSNPNNYATFNDELWRIIGLVNTPEGQRLKLIRNTSFGEKAWDTSEENINNGWGVNEWSQSDLKVYLNNDYYNKLNVESQNMLENTTWNTGTSDGIKEYNQINSFEFYNMERSHNTGKICSGGKYCSDSIARTFTWQGHIGLMYSSDYMYATSGNDITSREKCLNTIALDWDQLEECTENDWLFKADQNYWTISPVPWSDNAHNAYTIFGTLKGKIGAGNLSVLLHIYPTIFLNSQVKISAGNGSQSAPYILSLTS